MQYKTNLKSIRLTVREEYQINTYLKREPQVRNFSSLVRAALNSYLSGHAAPTADERPSFLWEYDLNPGELHEILAGPRAQRLWLVAKILEQARWPEIWQYLTRRQISADLPYLRLSPSTRRHWEYALRRWRRSA